MDTNKDKGQFTIPEGAFSEENAKARLEAARNNPELLREPFRFVKQLEEAVFSFRETAVALEQRMGRDVTVPVVNVPLNLPARHESKIYKELIENEWIVGGAMHQPLIEGGPLKNKDKVIYRFGLGMRGSSPVSNHIGDWYFGVPNASGSYDMHHYETSASGLSESGPDGILKPMTLEGIKAFQWNVYYYAHEVLEHMYPLDAARVELLNDVDIPDDIAALLPPEHGNKSDFDLAA